MKSALRTILLSAVAMAAIAPVALAEQVTIPCSGSNCVVTIADAGSSEVPGEESTPATVFSSFSAGNDACEGIFDLNLRVNAEHPWVGDLSVKLAHNGASATVIDRPGFPGGASFGCLAPDIDVLLNDEVSSPVESVCGALRPTISGERRPSQALSAFDGQAGSGTWMLEVTDSTPDDSTGRILGWELIMTCAPFVSSQADRTWSMGGIGLTLLAALLVLARRQAALAARG